MHRRTIFRTILATTGLLVATGARAQSDDAVPALRTDDRGRWRTSARSRRRARRRRKAGIAMAGDRRYADAAGELLPSRAARCLGDPAHADRDRRHDHAGQQGRGWTALGDRSQQSNSIVTGNVFPTAGGSGVQFLLCADATEGAGRRGVRQLLPRGTDATPQDAAPTTGSRSRAIPRSPRRSSRRRRGARRVCSLTPTGDEIPDQQDLGAQLDDHDARAAIERHVPARHRPGVRQHLRGTVRTT